MSDRTIKRDIKHLRDVRAAPIAFDPGTWDVVLQALQENRSIVFGYTAIGYTTAADKIADPYHSLLHSQTTVA